MTPTEIIERERRWALPAGVAGGVGFLLFFISLAIESGTDYSAANSLAEQLTLFDDGLSTLLTAAAIRAVAYACLATVLYLLFQSARARTDTLNSTMSGFTVIGPALLAIQGVVTLLAINGVAEDYVKLPAPEVRPAAALTKFERTVKDDPNSIDSVLFLTDADVVEYEPASDAIISIGYPDKREGDLIAAVEDTDIDTSDQSDGDAGELQAQQLLQDSGARNAATLLIIPAALAMLVALFYTSRAALRVGLVGRFWGTFGMAVGVAYVLIPFLGLIGSFGWALYVGAVMGSWAFATRPPAWDAGEAMPWDAVGGAPAGDGGEFIDDEGGSRPADGGPMRKRKQRRR